MPGKAQYDMLNHTFRMKCKVSSLFPLSHDREILSLTMHAKISAIANCDPLRPS